MAAKRLEIRKRTGERGYGTSEEPRNAGKQVKIARPPSPTRPQRVPLLGGRKILAVVPDRFLEKVLVEWGYATAVGQEGKSEKMKSTCGAEYEGT